MKKFLCHLALLFAICFLLPQVSLAEVGNDNPTGPTGEYNGSITTGGSYDPYTGNAKRFVDDLTVTGSVGAYPLKWARVLNTRSGAESGLGHGASWSHSYNWKLWVRPYEYYHYHPEQYDLSGPGGIVNYPDGRTLNLAIPEQPYTYFADPNIFEPQDRLVHVGGGNFDLLLRDGGKVKFQHPAGSTSGSDLVAAAIVDPYGQTTTLTRDGAGRIWRITDPSGRYLQINYTTFANIWQLTGETRYTDVISSVQAFSAPDQLTETVTYDYTSTQLGYFTYYDLTQANYDDGTHAVYTYAGSNGGNVYFDVIHSCDDVRFAGPMKKIEYEYMVDDGTHEISWGQIKREKNATTHQVVSEVTYPPYESGPWTAAHFQRTETRPDGASRLFQYSDNGSAELTSYTDFKAQTTYIDYPWGSASIYRKRVTDARGNATLTDMEWNVGAVMTITHPDWSTIQFTYTDANNPYYVASRTDERGYITSYTRDGNHRITDTSYPDGATEHFEYNILGQVLSHRLTSGGTETSTYDGRGLKTSHTDPYGNVTNYHYYQSGPNTDRPLNVVDPRGNATSYEYNGRGEVTKVTHQDGSFTQSTYNPDGTVATATDELGHATSYTYDEYKRVLTVTNPLNQATSNSYEPWSGIGSLSHTTASVYRTRSPMGKITDFNYDENFRRFVVHQGVGTPADDSTTVSGYDAVGNLSWVRDPRSQTTNFGYDNRNRQTSITDALGNVTSTTYDVANNKTSVTRPGNPSSTRFVAYDPMNRLLEQIDEGEVHTYFYYEDAA
ncbi:MAG: hypothetical protein QOD12_1031, partial [Verrucomicrobiota bacterium]